MFAKSRIPSVNGRIMLLISSIEKMSGVTISVKINGKLRARKVSQVIYDTVLAQRLSVVGANK